MLYTKEKKNAKVGLWTFTIKSVHVPVYHMY